MYTGSQYDFDQNPGGIDMSQESQISTFQFIKQNLSILFQNRAIMLTFVFFLFMLFFQIYTFFQSESYSVLVGVLHILEQLSYFVIICASSLLARRKPTFEYSYGYNRHEVLAVFTVSISVIFISLFFFMESFHRLSEEEATISIEVPKRLLIIHFIFLLFTMSTFASIRNRFFGKYSPKKNRSWLLQLLTDEDVLLYIVDLAFFLGAHSTSISKAYLDVIEGNCSLFLMILYSFYNAKYSCLILLQTVPPSLQTNISHYIHKISILEGILEIKDYHIWSVAPNEHCISIIIRANKPADEQKILLNVYSILDPVFAHVCIQIEKDLDISTYSHHYLH